MSSEKKETRRQKHVIYHCQNTVNRKGTRRGREGQITQVHPNLGPDPDHPDRPVSHGRSLSQQRSLLALRPSMRGLPHLLMQMPPCTGLHPSRIPLPVLSQLGHAKIMGSPHTKTRRLRIPEWGSRVAVNITSSLDGGGVYQGKGRHRITKKKKGSSLFLVPITQHEQPSISAVLESAHMTKPRKGEGRRRR